MNGSWLTLSADYQNSTLPDQDPLNQLPEAVQAPFDASDRQNDPSCLEGTRTEVLKQIRAWLYGKSDSCVFWLRGMAGTGKSTIARTFSRELCDRGSLGASFFFSRGGGDVGHAGLFFTSLAKQLAFCGPKDLRSTFLRAIRQHPGIASKSRRDQWSRLILDPLKQLAPGSESSTVVILVDALDECDDENAMEEIVDLLAQAGNITNVALRIVITSRPETPIRLGFERLPEILHKDIILHEMPREVVDGDICLYLYSEFNKIKERKRIRSDWPNIDTINHLVRLCSGLFIFAATIHRYVSQDKTRSAIKSLQLFLPAANDQSDHYSKDGKDTTSHLDKMYGEIVNRSMQEDEDSLCGSNAIKHVIGPMVTLFEPLSETVLINLLGLDEDDLAWRLDRLHSVVEVPENPERPIRLFHPSFRDFLTDRRRCGESGIWIDQRLVHQRLFHCCLQVMRSCLRDDICGLNRPGAFASDVGKLFIDSRISGHVQYACRYWSDHFLACSYELDLTEVEGVHVFLTDHLLHWLEVMGWIGRTADAITTLIKLQRIPRVSECAATRGMV